MNPIFKPGSAAVVRYTMAVFAAAGLALGLAAPAFAAPFVLECTDAGDPGHTGDPRHWLFEFDYAAQTVVQHYVDADGAPLNSSFHATFPITVTDEIISWHGGHQVGVTEDDRYRLGRFTGTLTTEATLGGFTDHKLRQFTHTYACKPYLPPNQTQQRRF